MERIIQFLNFSMFGFLSNRRFLIWLLLSISIFFNYEKRVEAIETIQFRREGFIYDEKGLKIGDAHLELELFIETEKGIESKIYQTVSNDLGLYFFNIFIELDPKKIVALSIYWRNYQSKFSDKYLKFTPGFNPHWEFTRRYLDKDGALDEIPLSRVRDIKLISMENPIPDSVAKNLALKFSPILVFDEDKKELPANLEKYKFNHSFETYKLKGKEEEMEGQPPYKGKYLRLPDLKKFKKLASRKNAHIYYHARPRSTFYTGMQTGRLKDLRFDYYWYESVPEKYNGYVISYWFWYDNTEGPSFLGNSHQGGLQGLAILLDEKKRPLRILTLGHSQVLVDTSWRNINSINNHPILYVSHGFWSDGTNITIPNLPVKKEDFKSRKSIKVPVYKRVVDWFGFPRDRFPLLHEGKFKLIIPGHESWGTAQLRKEDLNRVLIGPGPDGPSENSRFIDFSKKVKGVWEKAIKWEEPGWINQKAFKDPDRHHNVEEGSSYFMGFSGRLGRHPFMFLKYFPIHYYGQSPMNVPFTIEPDNIFIYEYPRKDRSFFFDEEDPYGPFWRGNEKTPQFINK